MRSLLWFFVLVTAGMVDLLFDVQRIVAWCGLRAAALFVALTAAWMSRNLSDSENPKDAVLPLRSAMLSWIRKLGVVAPFERGVEYRRHGRLRDLLAEVLRSDE